MSAYVAVAVTVLFWATAFVGIRDGLEDFSPTHLALLRFLIASAMLAVYAVAVRMQLPRPRDWPAIALLGFLGITVYHVALNLGAVIVPAGTAALIIAAAPVFTALLARAFLGERLTASGWAGMAVALGGVVLIVSGRGESLDFTLRALLIVVSAIATSLYFVFQKPLLRRYSALQFATYSIWAGTVPMLLFLPGLPRAVSQASTEALLATVYIGIFPTVGYITWSYALHRMPAGVAMSFLYSSPVIAILTAWLWRGEAPGVWTLVGGAIALAGVMLVNVRGRAPSEPRASVAAHAQPATR